MAVRVLHIIGQLGVGGCEKQLLEICRRMDRGRFDLGVAYYARMENDLVEDFRRAGVSVWFTDKAAVGPWRFFLALRRFIREFCPDVIHCWQYSPNCWGRLAAAGCGYGRYICGERTATRLPRPLRLFEYVFGRDGKGQRFGVFHPNHDILHRNFPQSHDVLGDVALIRSQDPFLFSHGQGPSQLQAVEMAFFF